MITQDLGTTTLSIISMRRSKTSNSGSPMWTCDTLEGLRVNIFQHRDMTKDSYHLFAQYRAELNSMKLDDVLRWTQHPIYVECVQDGRFYNIVDVAPRKADAVPDSATDVDLLPYRTGAKAWAMWVLSMRPLFLDIETSGTGPLAQIVEVAITDRVNVNHFHQLILPANPERLLIKGVDGKSAADINSITPERLIEAGARPFTFHAEQINTLLYGQHILIYNAPFDTGFLIREYAAAGLMPPVWAVHDVMEYARWAYSDWDTGRQYFAPLSLQEAARRAGIDIQQTHGALDDCRLTCALVNAIAGLDTTVDEPPF